MLEPKRRMPCKRYLQVFNRVLVEGRPLDEVARDLGLKYESVVSIVHKVRNFLRKHGAKMYLPDPGLLLTINARELYLARLEHQWQQAMEAWHRSKLHAEAEKAAVIHKRGGESEQRIEKSRRSQTGDIRCLVQARALLADIRAFCTDRPYATPEENHVKQLTLKQREDDCDRLLAENCERIATPPNAGTAPGREHSARAA